MTKRIVQDAIQIQDVGPGRHTLLFIQAILLALLAANVAMAWLVPYILSNISTAWR